MVQLKDLTEQEIRNELDRRLLADALIDLIQRKCNLIFCFELTDFNKTFPREITIKKPINEINGIETVYAQTRKIKIFLDTNYHLKEFEAIEYDYYFADVLNNSIDKRVIFGTAVPNPNILDGKIITINQGKNDIFYYFVERNDLFISQAFFELPVEETEAHKKAVAEIKFLEQLLEGEKQLSEEAIKNWKTKLASLKEQIVKIQATPPTGGITKFTYPSRIVEQYFGENSTIRHIRIEKKLKTWIGDPIKLEQDWKASQAENEWLKKQIEEISKEKLSSTWEVRRKEKEIKRGQLEVGKVISDISKERITRENTIVKLAEEVGKSREFEKRLRTNVSDMENVLMKLDKTALNSLIKGLIKKDVFLSSVKKLCQKIGMVETYWFLERIFNKLNEVHEQKTKREEKIKELEEEFLESESEWNAKHQRLEKDKNGEIAEWKEKLTKLIIRIIKMKERKEEMNINDWKTCGEPFLDFTEEITKEWKKIGFDREMTEEYLNEGILSTEYEFANWINDVKELDPPFADLDALRREWGKQKEIKQKEEEEIITKILSILDGWKEIAGDSEKTDIRWVIKKVADDEGSKQEQHKAVQTLLNDYGTGKKNNIELTNHLEQWGKLLSSEKPKKRAEDYTAFDLEGAFEKLDLTENVLNNQAEELLRQSEEITEKDNRNAKLRELFHGTAKIFNKQHNFVDQLKEKIQKEQQEKEKLRTEKEAEVNNLQEKIKDLKPNETEKQLLVYVNWKDWKIEEYEEKVKKELESGQTPFRKWDWTKLREPFQNIREKLLELVNLLIKDQEQVKHLKEDIDRLDNEKKELEERVKELEEALKLERERNNEEMPD